MGFLKRVWTRLRPGIFISACEKQDESLAISMLEEVPELAHAKDKQGISALFYAVGNGNLQVVERILNITKNPDHIEPESGFTPLLVAVTRGHKNLVQILLKYGANPNIRTHSGITALHNAVYENQLEIVHLLVDAKADPKIEDKIGNCAMDVAMEIGNQQIIEILGRQQLIFHHDHMEHTVLEAVSKP